MLSVAEEHLVGMNPSARLLLNGQDLNPESYAICKADMLIKGQDIKSIRFGNTLSDSPTRLLAWSGRRFRRRCRRKPISWAMRAASGPGLPRVSDGSLLFLLHLISKMRQARDDLRAARLLQGGGQAAQACFQAQQVGEKAIKALLAWAKEVVR
jgi:type I restriction enzyme M protein